MQGAHQRITSVAGLFDVLASAARAKSDLLGRD